MSKLKRNIIIATIVAFALIALALTIIIINVDSISDPYDNELMISQSDFRGQWPLTAKEGIIRCDKSSKGQAISFTTSDSKTYALNTPALNYSIDKNLGWQPLALTDSLWLNREENGLENGNSTAIATKVPLDDMIEVGLTLCPS